MSDAEFTAIALFAKPDPNRDYEWMRGRDAIPGSLFDLCQYLARTANEKGHVLAAAASLPEGVYLARSFHQGMDSSYRPSFALEVGAVRLARPLEPEHLLGLAWLATRKTWPEEKGSSGQVGLDIPAFEEQPVALGEEVTLRARLGLPVSAGSLGQALALLRRFPQRFPGVACTPKLRGSALPWSRDLAHLLGVHFGEVELDEAERVLLAQLARRPPTPEEWRHLDLLAVPEIRRLLLWAMTGEGRPFPGPADDAAAAWLVAFRRSTMSGTRLLAALRSDLGLPFLPRDLLAAAMPEISAAALEVLAACEAGGEGELEPGLVAQLAAAGLLGIDSPLPPRSWLRAAQAVPAVAAAGLDLLRAAGVSEAAARWLLGGSPASSPPPIGQAMAALAMARSLDLEVPPAMLWSLLDCLQPPADLDGLGSVAGVFGPLGPAVCAFLRTATLPAADSLAGTELLRAAVARRRLAGYFETADLLLQLLRQGRAPEASAVLDAAAGGELPRLPDAVATILAARLEGASPVELGGSAQELLPFAGQGLIRPGDVVPRGELRSFLEIAAMWPETASLAAVLRGEPRLPQPGDCPPAWRAPLQEIFTRGRVASWLSRWRGRDLCPVRGWLCEVLDLPPAVRCLAGEPERNATAEPGELAVLLPWLAALWQADSLAQRLGLVVHLAAKGWLAGEDRQAAGFAGELLAGSEPELRDLCVHLLSRRGPLPPVGRIAPDSLASLLAAVADPVQLLDSLFASRGPSPVVDSPLVEALVERVRESGVACPAHGYTAAQLERQARLASRLALLRGWESCALDLETRRRIARRCLSELDLPCPANWSANEELVAAGGTGGSPPAAEGRVP
jgi:hypothetical protein